jgi:hypothetical protein
MEIEVTATRAEFNALRAHLNEHGYRGVVEYIRHDCTCLSLTRLTHGVHVHARVVVTAPAPGPAPVPPCTQHLPHPHGGLVCARCWVCVAENPAAAGMTHEVADEVADEVAGRVQDATGVRPDSSWLANVVKVDPNHDNPTDPHVTVVLMDQVVATLPASQWARLHIGGINPATLTLIELIELGIDGLRVAR